MREGASLGDALGFPLGETLGTRVGLDVGKGEGIGEGGLVGDSVGLELGFELGATLGFPVGAVEGAPLGPAERVIDGAGLMVATATFAGQKSHATEHPSLIVLSLKVFLMSSQYFVFLISFSAIHAQLPVVPLFLTKENPMISSQQIPQAWGQASLTSAS